MHEMIYTSAEETFDGPGYGVVARTAGLPFQLESHMRLLSRYDLPLTATEGRRTPIVAHTHVRSHDTMWHVFSRSVPAGRDYTGRAIYLSHHLALPSAGMGSASPFDICNREDLFRESWQGTPRILIARNIALHGHRPNDREFWRRITGSNQARDLWLGLHEQGDRPLLLLASTADDAWNLLCEAAAQLTVANAQSIAFVSPLAFDQSGAQFDWIGLQPESPLSLTAIQSDSERLVNVTAAASLAPRKARQPKLSKGNSRRTSRQADVPIRFLEPMAALAQSLGESPARGMSGSSQPSVPEPPPPLPPPPPRPVTKNWLGLAAATMGGVVLALLGLLALRQLDFVSVALVSSKQDESKEALASLATKMEKSPAESSIEKPANVRPTLSPPPEDSRAEAVVPATVTDEKAPATAPTQVEAESGVDSNREASTDDNKPGATDWPAPPSSPVTPLAPKESSPATWYTPDVPSVVPSGVAAIARPWAEVLTQDGEAAESEILLIRPPFSIPSQFLDVDLVGARRAGLHFTKSMLGDAIELYVCLAESSGSRSGVSLTFRVRGGRLSVNRTPLPADALSPLLLRLRWCSLALTSKSRLSDPDTSATSTGADAFFMTFTPRVPAIAMQSGPTPLRPDLATELNELCKGWRLLMLDEGQLQFRLDHPGLVFPGLPCQPIPLSIPGKETAWQIRSTSSSNWKIDWKWKDAVIRHGMDATLNLTASTGSEKTRPSLISITSRTPGTVDIPKKQEGLKKKDKSVRDFSDLSPETAQERLTEASDGELAHEWLRRFGAIDGRLTILSDSSGALGERRYPVLLFGETDQPVVGEMK